MDILLLVMIIISALLFVIMVMLQDEGGEGLGGIFGGGSSTPFGSRAGNALTRITTILAIVFLACTVGLAYIKRTPPDTGELLEEARQQKYEQGDDTLWYVPLDQLRGEEEDEGEGAADSLSDQDDSASFSGSGEEEQ